MYKYVCAILSLTLFTYPDVCLRSRDILALPRVDPRPILVTFLQDLKAKMSTLCGHLLQLQSRANYLLTELNSVTQVTALSPW